MKVIFSLGLHFLDDRTVSPVKNEIYKIYKILKFPNLKII